jgi:hypothetical protein
VVYERRMSLLDRLLGRSKAAEPPPPAPPAPAPAPAAPQITLVSPLEGFPGAAAALAANKRGDRSLAERLYHTTRDSGMRYALVRQLADDAPRMTGAETPFDAAVAADDWFARLVRGMYQIRIGWEARGSGTGDTVTDDGAKVLLVRCDKAVEDLEEAAHLRPDDEVPLVFMMGAARGLSDTDLGAAAYHRAVARTPDSWAAAFQRVEWLSPRWFGSIDEVLAYARAESARVGRGELAALPILAHNDLNIYHAMFQKDREAAAAAREAAAPEIRDCVARAVDAGLPPTYATPIIRHYAGSLLWQVADEAGARAQLSKVGNVYEGWCWMQNQKAYLNVRSRLNLD